MTALNISVSKLCSFDDYLHGRWNQDDDSKLKSYIMGTSVKTYEQGAGDAVHAYIEAPDRYPCTDLTTGQVNVNGHMLAPAVVETCFDYWMNLPCPFLFEQWLPAMRVVVKGYEVFVRARIDVLTPEAIRDIKTSTYAYDHDKYADSFQWRFYLWMASHLDMDTFIYDHFQWKSKETELKYSSVQLYRYPTMEQDCQRILAEFIDYLESQELIGYCVASEKSLYYQAQSR
ncbi:hypothetical protein [Spirosoma sordidisoli]|uniref:Uncharacterized protein n=1 Tax=Spirosoma sordidisoli TaxID=2502893 RepID=A0A4V1RWM0_9BACT|nr:hypothetical protein [Spirosoma sordidisoli]RYC70738.1 hypothetical protein EQG79_00870 [Spirosoma sordidisoli]